MKLIISFLASFFILFSGIVASAQINPQDTLPYKRYEFGLFGTGGLSIFQPTPPDGTKTDVEPAYTFGALGTYAANRDIGFALGLGYESRGMFFKEQNKTEPNEEFRFSYFAIQPSLRFKSFLIGVNINIPVGFNLTVNPGSGYSAYSRSIGTDTANTLIDIRAEGLLPIVENDFGNLYFIIQASYCLSDAVGKGGFYTVGQNPLNSPDPVTKSPMPSVQLGLSYLFSPGAKTK